MTTDPDQAWKLVLACARPLPAESLPLADAGQHVLAAAVCADRDIPPADRAAMDGYAVRCAELSGVPLHLPVVGETAAGSPPVETWTPNTCVRIFTGANLPAGADAVIMQEDTEPVDKGGRTVRVLALPSPGQHVFKRGENAAIGETLLPAGAPLDGAAAALCACVGKACVKVHRYPRVAILGTGTELLDAGDAARAYQSRNSNTWFIHCTVAARGYPLVMHERTADDVTRISEAVARALEIADVTILTGGVSVGRFDCVADAVRRAGVNVRFHGVAIKPGKPVLFGTGPEDRMLFGLPGNPLSAMVVFHEFVLPALLRLAGHPPERCRPRITVRLRQDVTPHGRRRHVMPARLIWNKASVEAEPILVRGTADLVAGARADGALIVPAGSHRLPAGTRLFFRPWRTAW